MAKLTPEEIKTIKYAVKPLTPEERAEINAIRFGEPVVVETEAEAPVGEAPPVDTSDIPNDALEAKARQLGIPVSDLTVGQIEEVRASLPKAETRPEESPTSRRARRRT